MRRILILVALVASLVTHASLAHEVRPAYLEIRQTAPDTYDVLFKVPALGEELRFGLSLDLPEDTQDIVAPRAVFNGGAHVERRSVRLPGGFAGHAIAIEGLSATVTDVLVRGWRQVP